MTPTPQHHFIFVRPPGSWTWTLHYVQPVEGRRAAIFRTGDAAHANRVAAELVEHSKYCAIVATMSLPQEQDTEQYALFADGDTLYMPTEPLLLSRATGKPLDDGVPENADRLAQDGGGAAAV